MVFPPQWTPAMSHLALPVLTACLRSHGVHVVQRDLNVETNERLLDVLPTKRYGQYYVHDVYRFLYASRLHTQNQPLPLWLADEEVKHDAIS